MVQEGQGRKKYPSDLTDEQWAIVAPLIPPRAFGDSYAFRSRC